MATKRKKKEIPARSRDQEKSHRLHRAEQPQYPDEGRKGNAGESGATIIMQAQ